MNLTIKEESKSFIQRAVEQFAALCDMPHSKILLAVSGGADSSVMFRAALEFKKQYPLIVSELAVAHVNFHLRGEDSDRDEKFVRQMAENHDVKFFCKEADTLSYAKEKGLSIEMAAREIRYNWFYELSEAEGFTHLSIAHNANDNGETLLLNLVRGTSLSGLCAIRKARRVLLSSGREIEIIRPLLWAERSEIEAFAIENDIEYVTDKTNFQTKFARNKLRNVVTPVLAQINPSVIRTLNRDIENFNRAYDALSYFIELLRKRLKDVENEDTLFSERYPVARLQKEKHGRFFIASLLKSYGFTQSALEDLCNIIFPKEKSSLKRQEPKLFSSQAHTAVVERGFLKIYDNTVLQAPNSLIIKELPEVGRAPKEYKFGAFKLLLSTISKSDNFDLLQKHEPNSLNTNYLDADKIELPLRVRPLKAGDRFSPLGLKGTKKVVDFLNGRKIDVLLKNLLPIITDKGGKVIAVGGVEVDNSVKVSALTKQILIIKR